MQSAAIVPLQQDRPRLRAGWLVLFLGVLTGLGYGANLGDFFLNDDFCTIGQHRFVRTIGEHLALAPREQVFFLRPLAELGWWIDLGLFGLDPRGYHVVNCGFHLANAVLLAQLTLALSRSLAAAWVAGACFVCFPLHPEAVTWLSGRVDVLCTSGVLASLVCWTRYCRSDGRPHHLAGACAAFVLALGCKEMAVALPLLASIIAIGCFRGAGARVWRGLFLLYALLIAYGIVRWIYLGGIGGYKSVDGRHMVLEGSISVAFDFLRHAAEFVFIPSGDALAPGASPSASLAAPIAWCAALLACLILRVPKRTICVALTCCALFVCSTAPVAAWARIVPGMQEGWRFLYLPSAFACATLGMTFSFAAGSRPRAVRIAAFALASIVLCSNLIGLRALNSRWHAAAQLSESLVEGVRQRYEGLAIFPPLVFSSMPREERGLVVFRNGFDFAIRLWIHPEIRVIPDGTWKRMRLLGEPLPDPPPIQLAWDKDARAWKDVP